MTIRPCLYAAAILILLAGPASAEMYQWVDDSGVKHFANTPPPTGVKAENSWAEVQYNETADTALAAENERVIKAGNAQDAVAAEMAAKEAAASKSAMAEQLAALETKQAALAKALLSDRLNFRDQANPLRRKLQDLERTVVVAEASGADASSAKKERLRVWNELFTTRYVVRNGYSLMELYQKVTREIEALGG
ncbi:MAG: DUF4124 domain-containing protein [Pseudomonadota bacterium]